MARDGTGPVLSIRSSDHLSEHLRRVMARDGLPKVKTNTVHRTYPYHNSQILPNPGKQTQIKKKRRICLEFDSFLANFPGRLPGLPGLSWRSFGLVSALGGCGLLSRSVGWASGTHGLASLSMDSASHTRLWVGPNLQDSRRKCYRSGKDREPLIIVVCGDNSGGN